MYLTFITTHEAIYGGIAIVLIAIACIIFLPKRHLCQQCRKKKTHRQEKKGVYICESCYYDNIIPDDKENLYCPHDGHLMRKALAAHAGNAILHVCPDEACQTIIIKKKELKKCSYYDNIIPDNKDDVLCPHDGKIMKKTLTEHAGNAIFHVCPDETCQTIIIKRKELKKLSILNLKFHFPKRSPGKLLS